MEASIPYARRQAELARARLRPMLQHADPSERSTGSIASRYDARKTRVISRFGRERLGRSPTHRAMGIKTISIHPARRAEASEARSIRAARHAAWIGTPKSSAHDAWRSPPRFLSQLARCVGWFKSVRIHSARCAQASKTNSIRSARRVVVLQSSKSTLHDGRCPRQRPASPSHEAAGAFGGFRSPRHVGGRAFRTRIPIAPASFGLPNAPSTERHITAALLASVAA